MEPPKIWPWLDPGSIRLGHLGSWIANDSLDEACEAEVSVVECGPNGLELPRLRVPKGVGSLKTPGYDPSEHSWGGNGPKWW